MGLDPVFEVREKGESVITFGTKCLDKFVA